jgi:hypothetical protein
MTQLEARITAETTQDVVGGEFAISVTFVNRSDEPARLNTHQAAHPALVLDVRDAKDEVVLLAPPSAPDAEDLEPGELIEPGAEVVLVYASFLDRSLPAGSYRVRYFGAFEALGGSADDPLASDVLDFTVRAPRGFPPGKDIPGLDKPHPDDPTPEPTIWWKKPWPFLLRWLTRFWCWLRCLVLRWIFRRSCERVVSAEFDESRTETISNAPPGSEAWNGTYGWRARFLLTVDESVCRATATIRVRLVGTITTAQRAAWETAIEAAWNNRFKLCSGCWCCCDDGMAIVCDIQFVTSGEHQVVTVGTSTTNMGNWGAADTIDISHEFGHMLGALDEYFTVNGTNWGVGRQATGAIMNNPANPPAARHYELVRAAAASLLGRSTQTTAVGTPCR